MIYNKGLAYANQTHPPIITLSYSVVADKCKIGAKEVKTNAPWPCILSLAIKDAI